MKYTFALIATTIFCAGISATAAPMRLVTPEEIAARGPSPLAFPLMHPDTETLRAWNEATRALPRAPLSATRDALPAQVDLLPYYTYVPEEYDQGHCGNCWVWASMGALQMTLNVHEGIAVRLSPQHYTSCYDGDFACYGGFPQQLAAFANRKGFVIPSTNANAHYQQFDAESYEAGHPAVHCQDIADVPRYLVSNCTTHFIPTYSYDGDNVVSDTAQAVTAIKQQLHAGNAVVVTLYYPDGDSISTFLTFWSDYGEEAYLDVTAWGGRAWNSAEGSGHAMLIVGYTEEAWIVLNSWGTMEGLRPNGTLAFGPIDSMDYGATYSEGGDTWPLINFYVHPVSFQGLDSDGDNVSDAAELEAGTDPDDFTDVPSLPLHWVGALLALAVAGSMSLGLRRQR
jgi:C1A family cysteine protease